MADPYKVLGVDRSASPAEIKKAYSTLAKRYHPDLHPNDPTCEQKMKEINGAYDAIVKGTADEYDSGETGSQWGYRSSGYDYNYNYGGSARDDTLGAAATYINAGMYREALNVLSGIEHRTARWYFLSAVANAGIGNRIAALEHARTACEMEPQNPEYARLLNNLEYNSATYRAGYENFPQMRISPFTVMMLLCMLRTMCLGGGGWGFFC